MNKLTVNFDQKSIPIKEINTVIGFIQYANKDSVKVYIQKDIWMYCNVKLINYH
ncbi:hypothetical protein [Spirosoma aerolatum]|uniref:hypothetical protein n=1 Tax=Spirosoma aerolatum TaxID=1211326 RepID=UPI0012D2A635|nr:hypothetical protein [Spirosoma aerolatum]